MFELTMLGGRNAGDGDEGGGRSNEYGGGFQSGRATQGSGPRESFAADLDDDIPF